MAFLPKLSNTLQSVLGFGVSKDGLPAEEKGLTRAGPASVTANPTGDIGMAFQTDRAKMGSHLNYFSFSSVDLLMARVTAQAIHQASKPEIDHFGGIDHWDVQLEEIIQSIEQPEDEDPFQFNLSVACDRMEGVSIHGSHGKRKRAESSSVEERGGKRKRQDSKAGEENQSDVSGEEENESDDDEGNQSKFLEVEDVILAADESFGQDDSEEHHEEQQVPVDRLSIGSKYREQLHQCSQMVHAGWKEDTILAYLKLDRYGYEPIFPKNWKADFMRFPPMLFAEDDQNSFIKALGPSNFRGIHAFDNFCKVGAEVRMAQLHHTHAQRRPEALLKKFINDYLKWAWKDAELTDDIRYQRVARLVAVANLRLSRDSSGVIHKEEADHLESRVQRRLQKTGDELLRSLRVENSDSEYIIDPPTLFGFAIVDMVVGVFAYEPVSRTQRSIGFFNFENRVSSTEHAIRVALLLHWARYSMLRVKEALKAHERWVANEELDAQVAMKDLDPDA